MLISWGYRPDERRARAIVNNGTGLTARAFHLKSGNLHMAFY